MGKLYDSYRDKDWQVFVKKLTRKYMQDMHDLAACVLHPPPCICWLCVFQKYGAARTKKTGRRYNFLTFLVWDIIQDINEEWLLRNKYREKIKINGRIVIADRQRKDKNGRPLRNHSPFLETAIFTVGTGDYGYWRRRSKQEISNTQVREFVNKLKEKNYTVRKVLEKIISGLNLFDPERQKFLNDFDRRLAVERAIKYTKIKRYQRLGFLRLRSQLEYSIWDDWQRSQPGFSPHSKRTWKKSIKPAILSQKIADFIYSLPEKKAMRRDLLRRFNIKRGNLEELHDWLNFNYGIAIRPEKSAVVYIGTMTTSNGRMLRIGVKTNSFFPRM